MLSICIAIHNEDVTKLVQDLDSQASALNIPYEILLLDDASSADFIAINAELDNLPAVRYMQNECNKGRSFSRNRLADSAIYPHLLFMDCDAAVCSDRFLRNYLDALPAKVVAGGLCYADEKPPIDMTLRWKYGREREVRSAENRQKNANFSFTAFNLLIEKSIFNSIRFNEDLSGYGHEDTLFGLELLANNLTVKHIDNPLRHCGLSSTGAFLRQIENSTDNLLVICNLFPYKEKLVESISLLRVYRKIQGTFVEKCFRLFYQIFQKSILRNLHSSHPNIRLLDFFKLNYLCSKKVKI